MDMTQIEKLSDELRLSPYQSYILSLNAEKYNTGGFVKHGEVLYAPYRCALTAGMRDYFAKVFRGPRADLIGADHMLVIGARGVHLYATGFYRARDNRGHPYYADSMGQRIDRSLFENILGL